jgi:DNA primase
MWADRGTRRELFPPPETIADEEHDGLLWLCEGESDVVRFWSVGLVAVGVPGAQNWKDAWGARFAGRRWRVVVVFDCDQAGRSNAIRVTRTLIDTGVDARILDLAPDRDDGFDLSDFLPPRAYGERARRGSAHPRTLCGAGARVHRLCR